MKTESTHIYASIEEQKQANKTSAIDILRQEDWICILNENSISSGVKVN